MSELMEKKNMSSNLKIPQNNGGKKEKLLLFFDENEELTSIEVVPMLHGLDENSDNSKAMIGVILNDRNNIIAIIYYHVRHGEEGEPGHNILKSVQVFMADRILQNIFKNDKYSIKVGFPFEETYKIDEINGQVIYCYFHIFKGNEYLHSRFGYLEKDKLDKMTSKCYKFIYEIEKIPHSKIDKKAYEEYCSTGRCTNFELTDSQDPQAPILRKKSFSTGKKFKGNEVAVVCTEVKVQKPNLQAGILRQNEIASYLTGLLIGFLFDLNDLQDYLQAIFHS